MKKYSSALVVFAWILFLSFSANPPQGNSGGPFDGTCARSGCHTGSGNADGNISIEGIPNQVEPGMTYPFTVVLNVTGGNAERGGFQMVATDVGGNDVGEITDPGSNSTTSFFQGRTYFEHEPAKNFNDDIIEYSASWTAPESGSATFYISGILANGNGSRSGDTYVNNKVTFTVAESNALSASLSSTTDVLCNGDSNGTAVVDASGGEENYTYAWDNNETDQMAVALAAGGHSVTVSDGTSEVILEFSIAEPSLLETELTSTSPLECSDDESSDLSANTSGGTPPYSYVWSNTETTQTIRNIGPGQYTVSITDSNGCIDVANVSLFAIDQEPPNLSAITNATLSLQDDGSVIGLDNLDAFNVSSSDNCDENIEIDWSPKSFDCDDVGLTQLTITATDQSGNSATVLVSVEIVDEVKPVITCISQTLQIATCAVFTYSQPVTMDNCNNTRLELISGVGINGSFPVGETRDVYLATDESGNTTMCEVVIINEPDINVETDITQISCTGANDGAIVISVTGNNEPFSIEISNGNRDQDLSSGIYSFIITDFTGCFFEREFEIVEPKVLAFVETQSTRPTNSNSGDGAIDITVNGGTPPYSYSWMVEDEFFSDDEDLVQLFPGMYSVKVIDDRGCELNSEVFVLEEVTSINDPEIFSKVSFYPIPADSHLQIDIHDLTFSIGILSMYSTAGELVNSSDLNIHNTINTSSLDNGVYVLKIKLDEEYVVRHILVQH